jgi:plastocyanin
MRVFRSFGVLAITALAMACSYDASRNGTAVTSPDPVASSSSGTSAQSGTMASTPLSATMEFGVEDVGSGFPIGHDQSGHAEDSIHPQNVVIDSGGTVTFNAHEIHQVAIYQPGKAPSDVNTSSLIAMPASCGPLPAFRIDDPVGRIPINGLNPVGCGDRTYTHTFSTPGKYLVICEVLPHFQNLKMYAWVTVR